MLIKNKTKNLPTPLAENWDWQYFSSCRGEDPAIFFHSENERLRDKDARNKVAKSICSSCPVQPQCLAHALSVPEHYGTWGGLSQDERKAIYQHLNTPKNVFDK